ncbi:MAG: hypothetical protein IJ568_00450 [Bacilli bacterium]|nr:hypothetical protein [Bacilli bacterium]
MSLIRCPECNKEISDTSNNCIHCGYRLKNNNRNNNKTIVVSVIGVTIFLIILLFVTNKKDEKLHYCYDEDYFYKQIKDEIHDEYWQYDFIDIDYCNSTLSDGELDAWCHFKYKKDINDNYVEKDYSKIFYCSHD